MRKSKDLLVNLIAIPVFALVMAISWIIPIAVITLIVLWLTRLYG